MKRKLATSRFVALIMMLILIVTITGCGSSSGAEQSSVPPTKEAEKVSSTPTPTTEAFEVPAINTPAPVNPETEITPTVEPTEVPEIPSLISEEMLAQTHWLAVRMAGTYYDGEAYEEDLTQDSTRRYELAIFDDGTAQWLDIAQEDGRLLDNPDGFWQISGDNMIFSRHEDISQDEEYETQYFYEEDGTLAMVWGETSTLYFEQIEMIEKIEPYGEWLINGVWKWESSEVEGYVDTNEDKKQYIYFYTDYNGEIKADYYDWFREEKFEDLNVNITGDYDVISGWAPWVADIGMKLDGPEDKMCAYLVDENCMYVENYYFIDSAPAISIDKYVRVPDKIGTVKLLEERANKNIIWLTIEEKLWVTPEDTDLIEQYGLPEGLDGYDYEIVSTGEEFTVSMSKDKASVSLIDWEVSTFDEKSDWQTLVARLLEDLEYGIDVFYYPVSTDGTSDEIIAIEEMYIP